ncbi:hypothetical protein EQU50_06790 [Candidatus Finniella inopinata]|uniref:Uncharacterized protein n=1 Tax=Candidatus Finniella inopinata TaxID=1696036 RepID=A0A4Q7DHJ8_9PROT|nr:hypothetical protein [Candidatus Finniella inopinata]RZI45515.1 hypothetical protein EQU50_06790 [Candidatus Finniella inopinata]
MLNDRYLGYDRAQTTTRLQTDARFNGHMAAVLAIDAMVMKAMNDDEFHDAWSDTKRDFQELIPSIISHAQTHERKEVFASLRPTFEAFLNHRHDTLRLAKDELINLEKRTSVRNVKAGINGIMHRVMHCDLGSIIFQMISMKDSIAFASSTRKNYRSFFVWKVIRQIHASKLNSQYIREHDERNVEALRTSVLVSRYVHRNFHNLFVNRQGLINDDDLMGRINISYTPIFAKALQGYLLMAAERYAEGLHSLEQAGATVNSEAEWRFTRAAGFGSRPCGFANIFDDVSGRAYLEARVRDHADQEAQQQLNHAASSKFLGFDDISGRAYLEERVRDHNDQNAQQQLYQTACFCQHNSTNLGFNALTGRAYLEERAGQDDQSAQQQLNHAASSKFLGFDDVSGRSYLEARASQGDQHAQQQLNQAAYFSQHNSNLGFNAVTGRAYLEERIKDHADQSAQRQINWAASSKQLGFNDVTGRAYLDERIGDYNDQNAQEALNCAILTGSLGFNDVTGRAYLEERARNGDQHAQTRLNQAASKHIFLRDPHGNMYIQWSSLGFDDASGDAYLEERAKLGDQDAQHRLSGEARECPFTSSNPSAALFFYFYNAVTGFVSEDHTNQH